jgi:hypothetical protein
MLNLEGLIGPQGESVQKVVDSLYFNGIANDLSETGCGKTYVACAVARAMNRPVVIVCPKSVRTKWKNTMAVYGVKPALIINYELLARGNTPHLKYDKKTIVDKYGKKVELPRFCLTRLHFPTNALVILDEAHRCKGTNSLNAGIMLACKRQGYYLYNLSASMATSPLEMRAFAYANNLVHSYASKEFKTWCIDQGAEYLGRWGALTFDKDNERAVKAMKAVHHNLFDVQKSCVRLTRTQMKAYFPENHISAEAIDMGNNTAKIQAVYDHLAQELAKLAERTDNYGECILSEILAARQKVELLKVPTFVEMIEDGYDEGNSVVCFVNFTATLEAIAKHLKHHPGLADQIGYIYGGQSDKQRERDIEDFQADRKRIILANQAAGGVAIDLHDLHGIYPRLAILSPTYSAIQLLQALGRIHRQGGKTPAYQMLLFAAGTIEERACRKVSGKLDNLSILNDGDLTDGLNLFRK